MAAAIAIAAIAVAFFRPARQCLVLRGEDGARIAVYPAQDRCVFSVSFRHSVNQSEVSDVYTVESGQIFLTGGTMKAFGAGVDTMPGEGERFRYGADGTIHIEGRHTPMAQLTYVVGTVYDHYLHIGGKNINLTALCGKDAPVRFSIEKTRAAYSDFAASKEGYD